MDYGPLARIFLRYLAGGLVLGSDAVGQRLAADPDVVLVTGLVIAGAVELIYAFAKRRGWAT